MCTFLQTNNSSQINYTTLKKFFAVVKDEKKNNTKKTDYVIKKSLVSKSEQMSLEVTRMVRGLLFTAVREACHNSIGVSSWKSDNVRRIYDFQQNRQWAHTPPPTHPRHFTVLLTVVRMRTNIFYHKFCFLSARSGLIYSHSDLICSHKRRKL